MSFTIGSLTQAQLPEAIDLYRQAFRTFLNIPDWLVGEADYITNRLRAEPEGAITAEREGKLAATCLVSRWGSLAILGPVTVRPEGWSAGAGTVLMRRCQDIAAGWGCRAVAAFTFSQSTRHQKFMRGIDMWPRWLTYLMSRPIRPGGPPGGGVLYSALDAAQRAEAR